MKVEPFGVGDFVHIYNQGNNKEAIFADKSDRWRFLWSLRFFNDQRNITEFARSLGGLVVSQKEFLTKLGPRDYQDGHNTFEWHSELGEQQPLVEIIAYHLAPNHYHLLVREIVKGGTSKFMQKLGGGYTMYRNAKSANAGRIFRSQYRGKLIDSEKYLQYVDVYIQVFNAFELFDGGIEEALKNFDQAFSFALDYPFNSLGESYGLRNLGIIQRNCFNDIFDDLKIYKEFSRDALITRNARQILGKLKME